MKESEKEYFKKWKAKISIPEEIKHLYSGDTKIRQSSTEQDPSKSILQSVYKSKSILITSGRLVLTTEGESEFASELIWDLPEGTHKIEFGKVGNDDCALIKYREPFEDVYQLSIFFSITHPKEKSNNYSPSISGSGSQLLMVDKEIWRNEKAYIYSKDPEDLELFQIKYKYLSPGALIITNIPSEYSDVVVEDDNTTHEYKAFAGFNRNGEILYLLIQRKSEYQYTNKLFVK